MCIKIDNRMECYECGYPMCESFWLGVAGINCDATQKQFDEIFKLYNWYDIGVPIGKTILTCEQHF